jgi:GNAT superfamily N-acetyltransferase
VGASVPGSNDYNDLRLIAALDAGAVTHLVSEDVRLRKRAARAGVGAAVLTVAEAVALLEELAPTASPPPPRVTMIPAYALDTEQDIFDSLRKDYPQFDEWLRQIKRDHVNRTCFVINEEGRYAGIALLKAEVDCSYCFASPVVKISTFKVEAQYSGSRYGELLLKAIFLDAHAAEVQSLYVEVYEHHHQLIARFEEFGFVRTSESTGRENELVLRKDLRPSMEAKSLAPLDYHVRYGPPALNMRGSSWFIPIEPRWHDQLFPDWPPAVSTEQLPIPGMFDPSPMPWGNSLRKAYLCRASVKQLAPGDTILFYRSRDVQAVTAVGVVEEILRTNDPSAILRFVGGRTVYSPREIVAMCGRVGSVLAILFRQDRFIEPPWPRSLLNTVGAMATWPQTVCAVRKEGVEWIGRQLDGLP